MNAPAATLAGSHALVTGAGRGIGAEIALTLAAQGASVACAARTRDEIDAVAARCGGSSFAVQIDVTSPKSVSEAVATAEGRFGAIDIVVNSAGLAGSWKFTRLEYEDWRQVIAVDLDGPFLVTKCALPGMIERGTGRVITIASIYGRIGRPYVSAYAAAKHGVIGLTRALASEYARSGVTFNCVCPGFVDTPMTAATVKGLSERLQVSADEATALLHTPQGRLVEPAEVAAVCLLLASTQGASINGQAIVVDGGEVQA